MLASQPGLVCASNGNAVRNVLGTQRLRDTGLRRCGAAQPVLPQRRRSMVHGDGVGPGMTVRLYEQALDEARLEDYEAARQTFARLTTSAPTFCKAWISWGQMEKRLGRLGLDPHGWQKCHAVLDRGLRLNPDSASLAQAWGLMELQQGNLWAAVRLLERSVSMDAACAPVLRWRPVTLARSRVLTCRGRACTVVAGAAAPAGGGGGGAGVGTPSSAGR